MKTKITIITLTLMLVLSVTACGSNISASSNDTAAQSTIAAQNSAGSQDSTNSGGDNSSQIQRKAADLIGEVTAISGNQVTLNLIEMPSFNGGGSKPSIGDGKGSGASNPTGNRSADAKPADNSASAPNAADSSTAGAKGDPSQGGAQGGGDKQPPQISMNYTGESKTLTIPDGVAISSAGRRNGNSEQKTLSVADIKQGSILQIWYSDETKETISKISIMEATAGAKNATDTK